MLWSRRTSSFDVFVSKSVTWDLRRLRDPTPPVRNDHEIPQRTTAGRAGSGDDQLRSLAHIHPQITQMIQNPRCNRVDKVIETPLHLW